MASQLIFLDFNDLTEIIEKCVQQSIRQGIRVEPKQDEPLHNIDEIAEYLGVSKVTIHAWKREGKLPFHRLGRRVYYQSESLLLAQDFYWCIIRYID